MKKRIAGSLIAGLVAMGGAGSASADTQVYTNLDLGERGTNAWTITLNGLDVHTQVTLHFDLYILDSWDGSGSWPAGDYFGFTINGQVSKWTFDNFTPNVSNETNTVAASSTGNYNSVDNWGAIDRYFKDYAGGFTINSASEALTLTFAASGDGYQGWGDETWQVKNLIVTTNANPVPEPTTVLLFGTGIAGLAGIARRKRD